MTETKWAEARKIAREVIQHFESCHLESYIFPLESWATIGWGCAISLKEHPRKITQAEADQMFEKILDGKIAALRKEIPAAVLDALSALALAGIISFRYNMKDSVWLNPHCNTRLALVKGDMRQFRIWMKKWINGEKGPLPGLRRRRRVEDDLIGGKSLEAVKKENWYQGQY